MQSSSNFPYHAHSWFVRSVRFGSVQSFNHCYAIIFIMFADYFISYIIYIFQFSIFFGGLLLLSNYKRIYHRLIGRKHRNIHQAWWWHEAAAGLQLTCCCLWANSKLAAYSLKLFLFILFVIRNIKSQKSSSK